MFQSMRSMLSTTTSNVYAAIVGHFVEAGWTAVILGFAYALSRSKDLLAWLLDKSTQPTPLWGTIILALIALLLYIRLRNSTSQSSDATAKKLREATLKEYEEHILHSGALVYVKKITPEYPVQTVYYSAVCMGVQRASPMFPAANGDSLFCHECNLKIGVNNMRPIFPKTLISPLNERRE